MGENSDTEECSLNEEYYPKESNSKSSDFDELENKLLLKSISEIIILNCEENESIDKNSQRANLFLSDELSSIPINQYIENLVNDGNTTIEILIIVLIYLNRLSKNQNIIFNHQNIHKFIFAAFIAAIKFYEDDCYSMSYYSKIGGISLEEAIMLEYEFMNLIDYNLFVKQGEYEIVYNDLSKLEINEDELIFL